MNDDKRQLLKLKQGLVSEDETSLEIDQKPLFEKPKGRAAVANFVYHHKLHLAFAAFFVMAAGFFAYFAFTGEKYDMTILWVADNQEMAAFFRGQEAMIRAAIEEYLPDLDNNGRVRADCRFIDLTTHVVADDGEVIGRNPQAVQGERVKLFGEVQGGDALIYLGNKSALENIPGEVTPVDDFYVAFYNIKDTRLAIAEPPQDLYIAVRRAPKNEYAIRVLATISR